MDMKTPDALGLGEVLFFLIVVAAALNVRVTCDFDIPCHSYTWLCPPKREPYGQPHCVGTLVRFLRIHPWNCSSYFRQTSWFSRHPAICEKFTPERSRKDSLGTHSCRICHSNPTPVSYTRRKKWETFYQVLRERMSLSTQCYTVF
jgi:hypothetical protein